MKNKLESFLERNKFKANPFGKKAAGRESDLPGYFVQNSYFDSILGSPDQPTTTFYFAARGNGKSAIAQMIEYSLTNTDEYPATLIVSLNREAFEELLEDAQNNLATITAKHYRQKLLACAKIAFEEQQERLKLTADFKSFLEVANLKELATKLHSAGVAAIYFLIDGVDELTETNINPENAAQLLLPLLTDLALLETQYVAFKFFLPLEIENKLKRSGKIRFDRFELFKDDWQWNVEKLMELLHLRLTYFSDGAITSLAEISDTPDIDIQMCEAAEGSPRNLIRLGSYLMNEHKQLLTQAGNDSQPISQVALDKAIIMLEDATNQEVGYSSVAIQPTVIRQVGETATVTLKRNTKKLILVKGSDVYIDGVRLKDGPSGYELKLLQILYENRGKTCSKDELLNYIYYDEKEKPVDSDDEKEKFVGSDDQLAGTLKRLRKKLNEPEKQYYVETVWGVGLRLKNYAEPA